MLFVLHLGMKFWKDADSWTNRCQTPELGDGGGGGETGRMKAVRVERVSKQNEMK